MRGGYIRVNRFAMGESKVPHAFDFRPRNTDEVRADTVPLDKTPPYPSSDGRHVYAENFSGPTYTYSLGDRYSRLGHRRFLPAFAAGGIKIGVQIGVGDDDALPLGRVPKVSRDIKRLAGAAASLSLSP